MGLVGNSKECAEISTNKHLMRMAFEKNGDPSPKSILADSIEDLKGITLEYPVIVKPTDRSGSRGITKLSNAEGLADAIETAKSRDLKRKHWLKNLQKDRSIVLRVFLFMDNIIFWQ